MANSYTQRGLPVFQTSHRKELGCALVSKLLCEASKGELSEG